ncbi:BMP family ABC transporter substrate-binding protein [Leifsonia shinshuensis]|uniref:BMP family ABC transporter substrate-binding protein n=1 Tax=Leifsonia shinshuensis TaxID=150026 RepID=A0A853CZ67_9MICO|nr:BMP family ABC transporter substrate-binding protein [Leifsonia shinshuensis]NYJ25912.1 hypothetical protein [Leifsonia shinshuensis]
MPRLRPLTLPLAALFAAVALLVSGCVAPAPAPVGTGPSGVHPLGSGFLGGVATPTPEATIEPERGSWAGVEPPGGYSVVLLSAGDDRATSTLVSGVTRWAQQRGVTITAVTARGDDEVEDRLLRAIAASPDLVIGAGPDVVDVFSLTTAQHLHQQFLIVGAELPEPTANVTSVIWAGASFRGTGISVDGDIDPAAVTERRASDAISAGVASVLHGLTGIVLHLR